MISSSINWRTICSRRLLACSVSGGTGALAVWFLKFFSTSERRIFLPLTVARAWSPSPLLRHPQTPASTQSTSNTVMAEADERVNRERNLKTGSSNRCGKRNYISYLRNPQMAWDGFRIRLFLGRPRRSDRAGGSDDFCLWLALGRWVRGRFFLLRRRLDPGGLQRAIDYCAKFFFRRPALHTFAIDEQSGSSIP